jgi:hypothetical protein
MKLLSSFARHPTTDTAIEIEYYDEATSKETYHVRPDVYEAVSAIARCKVAQIKNENGSGKNSGSYQTNLSVRNLKKGGPPYINLTNVKLTGADLSDADLSNVDLSYVDLSGAELNGADLSNADLSDANFSNANFSDADFSNADFSHVVWLTQEQLDKAAQHPEGKPPILPIEFYWDEDAAKKRYIDSRTPKS